jgi:glycerol dehydrogenase
VSKVLKSPGKYVQGQNVLGTFDQYLQGMGKRLLIIVDAFVDTFVHPVLDGCFYGKDYTLLYEKFEGECCQTRIDQLASLAKAQACTAVVGIGGGKTLDTAKGAAYYAGLPMIIVPTIASSDAPCSSCSVIYHEDGTFDRYLFLDSSPDIVLADTAIISKAPSRLLVAGMGDAMATWFEARACRASGKNNQVNARPTRAATGLARLCWENLKRDGLNAKMAVDAGICNEAVEVIVETNTYLSTIGFESGGLASAHGIQKGFTHIPALHRQLHGFNVAFCTLAQLVLEDASEDISEVLSFSHSVGLPICFEDLGYGEIDPDLVRKAARQACVPTSTVHNMPFAVTGDMVYQALISADAYGRAYRARAGA